MCMELETINKTEAQIEATIRTKRPEDVVLAQNLLKVRSMRWIHVDSCELCQKEKVSA